MEEAPSAASGHCGVCRVRSSYTHFGAAACSACAAFFRRSVTMQRRFTCAHNKNCEINHELRDLCKACRFARCIACGMKPSAVQLRRDCTSGRRKEHYAAIPNGLHVKRRRRTQAAVRTPASPLVPTVNKESQQQEPTTSYTNTFSPHHADVCSTSRDAVHQMVNEPQNGMPSMTLTCLRPSSSSDGDILSRLLREEQRVNERRRFFFGPRATFGAVLEQCTADATAVNDVDGMPFAHADLRVLCMLTVRQETRALVLLAFDWCTAVPGYAELRNKDKVAFLSRTLLFHAIVDSAYMTYRLGYPTRYVIWNGMYVGISEGSEEGWHDEPGFITGEMKKRLYRPLLARAIAQLVRPMHEIGLSRAELVALKALVAWKSTFLDECSRQMRDSMQSLIDSLFSSLHAHYAAHAVEDGALRVGHVVLLMSSVAELSLKILESHHMIALFELMQLDDLVLKFLAVHSSRSC